MKALTLAVISGAALVAAGTLAARAQDMADMTFFITSAGSGDGANLGGLAGADAICQRLAEAAGATGKTWRAYLSTSSENARDRIGAGPWQNAKGVVIAASLDDLHDPAKNMISKETGLTEAGKPVNGRGDTPNQHDILTGSNADGTANENTCGDWTLNGEGSAMVGHHDRRGLDDSDAAKSWNTSHPSRGCSQEALIGTGGNGYFYCFAAN
ncbi:MAG: hypothetical protein KDK07_00405 [Bauldia sp.]|nr:hypothetical protein [Bauldia sp.]